MIRWGINAVQGLGPVPLLHEPVLGHPRGGYELLLLLLVPALHHGLHVFESPFLLKSCPQLVTWERLKRTSVDTCAFNLDL